MKDFQPNVDSHPSAKGLAFRFAVEESTTLLLSPSHPDGDFGPLYIPSFWAQVRCFQVMGLRCRLVFYQWSLGCTGITILSQSFYRREVNQPPFSLQRLLAVSVPGVLLRPYHVL